MEKSFEWLKHMRLWFFIFLSGLYSADSVYIEIKFAHKLDAPAALGVKKDVLDIAQRRVDFVASKDHKKFELSIALENDIVPEVHGLLGHRG